MAFQQDGQRERSLADVIKVFNADNRTHAKYFFQSKVAINQSQQERLPDHRGQDQKDLYFSIEMRKLLLTVAGEQKNFIMVVANKITDIIRYQQRKSDEIYQEAIEANFSHEQMTPLNCILNCSQILIE